MRRRPARSDLLHAAAMGSVATGVALYWLDYFTAGHVRSSDDPSYLS